MEEREGWIWWDGDLVAARDVRLHILSYTVQTGAGVFEGVRAYEGESGTAIFRLHDHTKRLFSSARILGMEIPFTQADIERAHIEFITANKFKRCYLRPVVVYDGKVVGVSAIGNSVHVAVAGWEWDSYLSPDAQTKGIRVKTSSFCRPHINATMVKAKANGNYINSMLAVHEARADGFDDALLLDTHGYVAECSTSNVFVIRNGEISTPERTAILEGITRDTIITLANDRGWDITERQMTRDELYCADEIFITGTAAEVTPIVNLDHRQIGDGAPGKITKTLQADFFDVVRGRNDAKQHWLTPVTV